MTLTTQGTFSGKPPLQAIKEVFGSYFRTLAIILLPRILKLKTWVVILTNGLTDERIDDSIDASFKAFFVVVMNNN